MGNTHIDFNFCTVSGHLIRSGPLWTLHTFFNKGTDKTPPMSGKKPEWESTRLHHSILHLLTTTSAAEYNYSPLTGARSPKAVCSPDKVRAADRFLSHRRRHDGINVSISGTEPGSFTSLPPGRLPPTYLGLHELGVVLVDLHLLDLLLAVLRVQ